MKICTITMEKVPIFKPFFFWFRYKWNQMNYPMHFLWTFCDNTIVFTPPWAMIFIFYHQTHNINDVLIIFIRFYLFSLYVIMIISSFISLLASLSVTLEAKGQFQPIKLLNMTPDQSQVRNFFSFTPEGKSVV